MKRLLCLLLVLSLVLAGCGKKEAEIPTEPSTEATAAPTTEATEAPTTEATEPETEPTEPETEPTEPLGQVNPLTGEPLEEVYTGRPVAFSLNNSSACLPQYGLDKLDWMFEVETEGGITRCMGIMTNPANANTVGPIRSCRTYFLNLSVSYNAPLFHCGGSKFSDANQYSASTDTLSSWDHLNQMGNGGNYFYRETSRNGKYAFEHTLFTSGKLMVKGMDNLGYSTTSGEPVDYGYRFQDDVALEGQDAAKISIKFLGGKSTVMKYDADSGLYKAHQNGKNWIEGSTGKNATFRNILIVTTPQSKADSGHSFYELDGTGDGYYAVDGKMVPVKWHHEDAKGPFSFTMEDGTPITLGVGKTYCAIVSTEGSVTAE